MLSTFLKTKVLCYFLSVSSTGFKIVRYARDPTFKNSPSSHQILLGAFSPEKLSRIVDISENLSIKYSVFREIWASWKSRYFDTEIPFRFAC